MVTKSDAQNYGIALSQDFAERIGVNPHKADKKSELEALVCLLEDWAEWQKRYKPKIGFKSRSAGFASLGLQSFEDMCEQSDNHVMRIIESAIDDLCQENDVQVAAIYRRYGICAVFRFPRHNYEQVLIEAHQRLIKICKGKGVILERLR